MSNGTASQIPGSYVEFQAAILRSLPRDIDLDDALYWADHGQRLSQALRDALMGTRPHEFLTPVAEITIPATQGVDPSQYFQTREGLYVWPEFSERIVSVAKKTELPEVTFRSFELVKSANDTEIRSELPEDYVLEASELCGYLPEIIASQPGGEEGFLLTNGHPNVFYVRGRNGEVFAVGVLWDGVNLEWDVYADRLDDGHWSGGYRVISLATV